MLLAHLTDTHISTGPRSDVANARALQAFHRVQALRPRPDCTVITGDIVDQGTAAEYEQARALLDVLDGPVHVVPGNHDDAAALLRALSATPLVQAAVAEPDRCYYRVDYPGLRLLCCDSSVPGLHHGLLGETQLRWLDAELRRDPDVPAALAVHHHPLRSGIAPMDEIALRDADRLRDVLLQHRPLTRILTGHLHRTVSAVFAGGLVTTAPSTDRQVHLDLDPLRPGSYVEEPPGLLLHRLDGIDDVTHLLPVQHSAPADRHGW